MGNEIVERVESLPHSFKIHSLMCMTLKSLICKIMKIFPKIEEARPRCSSGIHSLCMLINALEKAKLLLQYCSESSKLYMAVTGDAILSRSLRAKNLLEQSLNEIENMVPVVLAVQISEIIRDLRSAVFTLDATEEEAGKAIADLMRRKVSSSVLSEDIKEFHFAAMKLQLSTFKAIVIERRSLKTLLRKLNEEDLHKRKILRYLIYLLQKHEEFINGDRKDNSTEDSILERYEGRKHHHERERYPPEEFVCPLSLKLMYDPVSISSGQTFERIYIQKWFDEGNDTCPKTKRKLENLLIFPNSGMKDLISKWCSKYGLRIEDPTKQSEASCGIDFSSISIASFGSSMCNLRLPSDISSISMAGSDGSFLGETPPISHVSKSPAFMPMMTTNYDNNTGLSDESPTEVEIELLCGLNDLPLEAQTKVVQDVRSRFERDNQSLRCLSPVKFLDPIVTYLKNAHDGHWVEGVRVGLDLLLMFLTKNRSSIESLNEEVFRLISIFLESEFAGEALNIVEVFSVHPNGQSKMNSSDSLSSLLKILDSETKNLQEQAIITLQNLSYNNKICLQMVSLGFIQKITSFLQRNIFKKHSIIILRNLSNTEEGRGLIATTDGCLASIAELLESESADEQENAVDILLVICMQPKFCYLVMEEGIDVIPSLVFISNNGSKKAKAGALELLRTLRNVDFRQEHEHESSAPAEHHVMNSISTLPTKPSPKKSNLFGFKFSVPGLKKKKR